MSKDASAHLTAELESALLRELRSEWLNINATYFKGKLIPPVIQLTESESRLGLWQVSSRTISLSRALVLRHPWGVVVEVLKHEVAHQYVHEVLQRFDETAHGPAFREVCQRLGIDATAAGLPTAGDSARPEDERVLARISRLLALAESDNAHEAESAMAEAQRLMLKFNLELGAAESRRGYRFRHLLPAVLRIGQVDQLVAMILSKHFFVEVIWARCYLPLQGRWARVLEICGTPANLEMAAYVHDFLHQAARRLWEQHQRSQRIRGNRDRRSFVAGVMRGFEEKLRQQQTRNQTEGLVWLGDPELQGFLRRRYPQVRRGTGSMLRPNEAYLKGREAGQKIVLHKPITHGSSGGGPALLPGK